ncbi:hypothetical protein I0C86_19345 [Plantactinospora sp. S1510]|uniref:Transposase n=1 Tax=Plantactinospora alkalitolerans TaxID=2789879 RepID=A0ABS0GY15_9ACTN|nr:hypothetical protein [Plantactinospora alkalitolerans]MBF9131098.1 hypothetical protein [Plantactinospora alkalitolerans]
MRRTRKVEPRHRRAWWRLWRYCRCGHRWRCPYSDGLVPAPWRPPAPPYRPSSPPYRVELTESERAEIRALTPYPTGPTAPSRTRAINQRPTRNAPGQPHPANGRTKVLPPAGEHRARRGARV